MNEQIGPPEAARALDEIDGRREQVIRRKVFPAWWWWAYAVLFIELTASVESGRGVLLAIGAAVFVVSSLVMRRAARAAAPRRGLAPGADRTTLLGVAGFVVVLLGAALGIGLSLRAAGMPHPGMIAAAVAGVVFAVGGPMLVRLEAAVLVRRSGRQG